MPDHHWENARHIWRHNSRPVRRQPAEGTLAERTSECVLCRVTFVPRYRTPLDLRDMIVCPPCRVRELEYNTKSRRRDEEEYHPTRRDEEEYHPAIPRPEAYDPPPARRRRSPVKKTKPKDKKPVTPKKDERPTAWDRILDPVLSV